MQKQDMVDGVLQDIHNNWAQLVYMAKDFVSAVKVACFTIKCMS